MFCLAISGRWILRRVGCSRCLGLLGILLVLLLTVPPGKTSLLCMTCPFTPIAEVRLSGIGLLSSGGGGDQVDSGNRRVCLECLPIAFLSNEGSLQLVHRDGVHKRDGGDKGGVIRRKAP